MQLTIVNVQLTIVNAQAVESIAQFAQTIEINHSEFAQMKGLSVDAITASLAEFAACGTGGATSCEIGCGIGCAYRQNQLRRLRRQLKLITVDLRR